MSESQLGKRVAVRSQFENLVDRTTSWGRNVSKVKSGEKDAFTLILNKFHVERSSQELDAGCKGRIWPI